MRHRLSFLTLLLLAAAGKTAAAAEASWRLALPGWDWQFPRDHSSHDDFRTEWWYVTGQVKTAAGRRFGYQFTIFRRGLRPPDDRAPVASRWVVNQLPLGHFALTDVAGRHFYASQRLERGAFGRAGFPAPGSADPRLAWIGDWEIARQPDQTFSLRASQPGAALDLKFSSPLPPLIHGEGGVSQKSAGPGNASHYYSLTRMPTTGTVTVDGTALEVSGLSWLDREWATNQLGPDQIGWDWISLHLSNGSDLMLYQLRRKDGTADPFSSATLREADGTARHLSHGEFSLNPVPGRTWTSAKSGGTYPVAWEIRIPAESLALEIQGLLPDQELPLQPVAYWEGAVEATGSLAGMPLTAEGYLEMTGYSAPLQALKQ